MDDNLVTLPPRPNGPERRKPPGWYRWSTAEKLEHLAGLSLDRLREYLSGPAGDPDPYWRAARAQVSGILDEIAHGACGEEAEESIC